MNSSLGWQVYDMVELKKTWCVICAKNRLHEIYQGWSFCLACGEQTEPPKPEPKLEPEPYFQIERFIKETYE